MADAYNDSQTEDKVLEPSVVSIHSNGFRDFNLKSEILQVIVERGLEQPSEGKYISCHLR